MDDTSNRRSGYQEAQIDGINRQLIDIKAQNVKILDVVMRMQINCASITTEYTSRLQSLEAKEKLGGTSWKEKAAIVGSYVIIIVDKVLELFRGINL